MLFSPNCFPRSTKRGLIEAGVLFEASTPPTGAFRAQRSAASLKPLVGTLRLHWSVAFRAQRSAASLKPIASLWRRCCSLPFRAQRSAASLKHVVIDFHGVQCSSAFRAQRSAASLKLLCLTYFDFPLVRFPRSTKRGLIEAKQLFLQKDMDLTFRAQRSAASLKPSVTPDGTPQQRSFPRSTKRGLIEALEMAFLIFHFPTFPRSTKRGLIEARRKDPTSTRGPAAFRAQRSAASLKPKLRLRDVLQNSGLSALNEARPH